MIAAIQRAVGERPWTAADAERTLHRTLRAARGHIDRWISAHGPIPEPIPEPTGTNNGETR